MDFKIAVIPGDGIGPEVIEQALKTLEQVGYKYDHRFIWEKALAGGAAIDAVGEALPKSTLEICQ